MNEEILLVEDDPTTINLIKNKLDSEEFLVHVAKNGKEGLAHALAKTPELIITDVMMPEMDGLSLYKELKDKEQTSHIPVIILSEKNEMRDAFIEYGADNFIAKPFGMDELLRKVMMSLRHPIKEPIKDKKIMIAGASPQVLEDIVIGFRSQGYYADYLVRGGDLLVQSQKYFFDVILLDVAMADMSPQDIIGELIGKEQLQGTHFLIFSAVSESDQEAGMAHTKSGLVDKTVTECLSKGAKEYVDGLSQGRCIEQIKAYLK